MSAFLNALSIFSPRGYIEGIPVGVTIDEQAHDHMTFTHHPVQVGAPITDHAFKNPVEIHVSCAWAQSGIISAILTGATSPNEVYRLVLALQVSARMFNYLSEGGVLYKNMVLRSITRTVDQETYSILALHIVLQQIIVVDVSTVDMPKEVQKEAEKTGSTEDIGQQTPKQVESGSPAEMVLYGMFGSVF